jgi:four helix bundle protein
MQDFRNVGAWEKAHALVLSVYRDTQSMPREEVFGITMQLRRGAMAVATRIAEGAGRSNNVEYAVDLRKPAASSNELEYLMVLARDLGYWKPELCERLVADAVEVRKMIFGLARKL